MCAMQYAMAKVIYRSNEYICIIDKDKIENKTIAQNILLHTHIIKHIFLITQ